MQRLDTPDGIAAVHSDHRGQFAIFTLEDGNRPTPQTLARTTSAACGSTGIIARTKGRMVLIW